MPITITLAPPQPVVAEVRRCPICETPYGDDGVPQCSFLSGRTVVTIIGGPL